MPLDLTPLLKLALIPLSILVASLVSRRFGHGVGGVISGMPMIAGPIVAVLLIDQPPATVAAIARATLASAPATVGFMVVFARCADRLPWAGCLAVSVAAFLAIGWGLSGLGAPAAVVAAIGLASPPVAMALMPPVRHLAGPVSVPRGEILMRMTAGVAVGGLILYGATHLPPRINGLLLAWPITGSILPCFTLPRYGRDATVALLRGFLNGLIGFMVFFVAITLLLETGSWAPLAFVAAFCAAGGSAWTVYRFRVARARVPAR